MKHSTEVSSFIQYSFDNRPVLDFILPFCLLFKNPNKKLLENDVAKDDVLI
jgi:hypothetical protein